MFNDQDQGSVERCAVHYRTTARLSLWACTSSRPCTPPVYCRAWAFREQIKQVWAGNENVEVRRLPLLTLLAPAGWSCL